MIFFTQGLVEGFDQLTWQNMCSDKWSHNCIGDVWPKKTKKKGRLVLLTPGTKGKNWESQAVEELPVVSVLSSYARHNTNKHIFQNVKLILNQALTTYPINLSCPLPSKWGQRTADLSTGATVREIMWRETHNCNYQTRSLLISQWSRRLVSAKRVAKLAPQRHLERPWRVRFGIGNGCLGPGRRAEQM